MMGGQVAEDLLKQLLGHSSWYSHQVHQDFHIVILNLERQHFINSAGCHL